MKLRVFLCHLAVPVGNHSMPSLLHLASSGSRNPIMGFSLNSPVFINASKPGGLQPVSFNRRWWALLCEKPNSDGYQQERSCVPLLIAGIAFVVGLKEKIGKVRMKHCQVPVKQYKRRILCSQRRGLRQQRYHDMDAVLLLPSDCRDLVRERRKTRSFLGHNASNIRLPTSGHVTQRPVGPGTN
jgi:hypothetical protein